MAPGLTSPISPVPGNLFSSYSERPGGSRQVSSFSAHFDSDNISQNGRSSRRESFMPRKVANGGVSNIGSLVQSLYQRSGVELGSDASSKLLNTDYENLKEWIRIQRMSHLPPEGSSYDKVLAWAQLFIDRLHHFDSSVNEFLSQDSYLATQMSYGYCRLLLEVSLRFFASSGRRNPMLTMISTAWQGQCVRSDDLLWFLLQPLVDSCQLDGAH